MTAYTDPILVVGAGPSALVLALSLLQNGIPVRIIEKEIKPKVGQRGASIIPRSLELFHTLRVVQHIVRKGIYALPCRMYQLPDGIKPIHTFELTPFEDPTSARPYLNMIQLGQDKMENILRAEIAKHSCEVEFGTELRSFEQFGTHVVADMVKTTESGIEIPESARFSFLGGTDGARGIVRKNLGLSFLGETRNLENLVVGDLRIMGLGRSHWHMWGDASSVLVSLRPTEDKHDNIFNFTIVGQDVDYSLVSSSRHELVKCITSATGRTDFGFGDMIWMSKYRPNIRMVNKLRVGRVFLAGDSAHVSSPIGGQGMNVGIQDSFNLAWKLALVYKGIAPPSLLDSYHEERYPVIAKMVQQTTAMLDTRVPPENEDGDLNQLDMNYRCSPIVFEDMDSIVDRHRIRAGDGAPSADGLMILNTDLTSFSDRETTLFDVFDASHHTVIIFSDSLTNAAPFVDAMNCYHPLPLITTSVIIFPQGTDHHEGTNNEIADFALEDRDGSAYDAYTIENGETAVVVVRPDGIVGARAVGVDGLKKYFDGLLRRKI